MTSDLYLVVGIVILVLAMPALIGAFSESRTPRAASIMILISGGLIAIAVANKPGGYEINDVPDAFVRVVQRYLN